MERHLNLIKSDSLHQEKRVFPRFPFCYLTFKENRPNILNSKVFEVKDISLTGMQLGLRDGQHHFTRGATICGSVHWLGAKLEAEGIIMWTTQDRLGVAFNLESNAHFKEQLQKFLSIKNIVAGLRPLHRTELGLELPSSLKYWLRADGPNEIFIWQHGDTEFSRFQILIFEKFVEWEDGLGLHTGRVLSKRDIETPLMDNDEFVFQMDPLLDMHKVQLAHSLVAAIPFLLLPRDCLEFLLLKLRT